MHVPEAVDSMPKHLRQDIAVPRDLPHSMVDKSVLKVTKSAHESLPASAHLVEKLPTSDEDSSSANYTEGKQQNFEVNEELRYSSKQKVDDVISNKQVMDIEIDIGDRISAMRQEVNTEVTSDGYSTPYNRQDDDLWTMSKLSHI